MSSQLQDCTFLFAHSNTLLLLPLSLSTCHFIPKYMTQKATFAHDNPTSALMILMSGYVKSHKSYQPPSSSPSTSPVMSRNPSPGQVDAKGTTRACKVEATRINVRFQWAKRLSGYAATSPKDHQKLRSSSLEHSVLVQPAGSQGGCGYLQPRL